MRCAIGGVSLALLPASDLGDPSEGAPEALAYRTEPLSNIHY